MDGTFTIDAIKAAKYFGEKPWRQMMYVLDRETGENWGADLDGDGQLERAPMLWHGSKNGTPPPPMISGFDNVCYRYNQYGTYEGIRGQISGWKFGTQYISRITRDYGASDEPHIASGGGRYLYWHICGDRESGWVDLSQPYMGRGGRGREGAIFSAYHLYRDVPGYDEMWHGVGDQDGTGNRLWGYYGSLNGIYHNQTNDQNPMVPYQGNLYVHRSNALICFGQGGGQLKGPKANTQGVTEDVPTTAGTGELKKLLAQEIQKWLDAGHLHIGYFNGSQFAHTPGRYRGLNDYFANPAENLWVLLRALPHVDPPLRGRLRAFIQSERQKFFSGATGRYRLARWRVTRLLSLSSGSGGRPNQFPTQPAQRRAICLEPCSAAAEHLCAVEIRTGVRGCRSHLRRNSRQTSPAATRV